MLQNVVPSYYRIVNDIRSDLSYLKRHKKKARMGCIFWCLRLLVSLTAFWTRLVSDQETLQAELDHPPQIYGSIEIDKEYHNDPFTFWCKHGNDLSLLDEKAMDGW